MSYKELLVPLYLKNKKAVTGLKDHTMIEDGDALRLAAAYDNAGADGLLVFDLSQGDSEHEENIALMKEIARTVDIPLYGGGNIRRMEDVKKLLYAGCRKVFLNFAKEENVRLAHEVSSRFGVEKILACTRTKEALLEAVAHTTVLGGIVMLEALALDTILMDQLTEQETDHLFTVYYIKEAYTEESLKRILALPQISGLGLSDFMHTETLPDLMSMKHALRVADIPVNTFEASLSWSDIKTGTDGLLPVVVQDYKTQEVLMVAYMNQQAFETTVRTGRMTYWSRSRSELWVKGLTSGHFQYVKELSIDCDQDTLLAKVFQVGAACHTGNRSCFYRTILKKEFDDTNPLKVFEEVFQVILDRRVHPKEGSYTNYLFEKGIDKILKKVGEEATEIIIAAKNPDPEEIKYEISDFLYHIMVLMAERGVSWEDITQELARR
ncbi:bifunctional phosphoribosyl-AMP cyclohydrolase/phosphoribosyl-ATP diphosphatase HisIE [bacterium 1XD42-54]|nr:bifunctional phosphoribosyl-AMP cyclohydrolase/phosphoribosyl-ATP diphosphatase HisIE [bacterium 1XD42-54]